LRVHDLAISPDGTRLVALLEKRILVYDFNTYEKLCEWQPEGNVKLTSVSISEDGRYVLVSMNEHRIELRDIETGEITERYSGHTQRQYIIRSGFGGAGEGFVVSGSEGEHSFFSPQEDIRVTMASFIVHALSILDRSLSWMDRVLTKRTDSRIYIWRTNGQLVEALDAHPDGCVNAVAWNPTDPKVFASAGDDKKVRIWKPAILRGENGYTQRWTG
jgi:WD40 repeat protein